uniref:glycosyltransferase family 4 protein n=1 Tax=Petrachloros mirabilis TaxID=2918835 RepID=UPI001EE8CC62|nr:glycosyltransferase family 1 protein [Petrachloros mirabilis]
MVSVHGDPAIDVGGEEAGGQNVYVRQVGETLAQIGWQVDMFTRKVHGEQPEIVQHHPRCRTVRLVAGSQDFVPRDQIFDDLPEFVAQVLDFQRQQPYDYALVHSNYWLSGWVGLQLKQKLGIPQVHTYHSLGAIKYRNVENIPLIATTRLAVEKACLDIADRVVATSPQEKNDMKRLVSEQGRIEIIPCGTDVERFGQFSRAAARAHLGIDPQRQVIFYVGRFDPRKGIEILVRAVAHAQARKTGNLILVIGGGSRPGRTDGLERERIESLVNDLGLADLTQFPGRISEADLPAYYAAADVSVVPSYYEPFGLVAIEAMASGTPVIASDVGGLQYTVIPEQTGLLVPPRAVESLAAAIDRVLTDEGWRLQLGQAAQARVRTYFSWQGVAQQLSGLYARLLALDSQDMPAHSTEADVKLY